jgi:hypothetical protein
LEDFRFKILPFVSIPMAIPIPIPTRAARAADRAPRRSSPYWGRHVTTGIGIGIEFEFEFEFEFESESEFEFEWAPSRGADRVPVGRGEQPRRGSKTP